jgi:hypothetical protein
MLAAAVLAARGSSGGSKTEEKNSSSLPTVPTDYWYDKAKQQKAA